MGAYSIRCAETTARLPTRLAVSKNALSIENLKTNDAIHDTDDETGAIVND